MKDTMVHIEYPDRTKFVSSMNHEQYEELKTYNDLDGGTSVSDESFVLRFDMIVWCFVLVPIRDVGEWQDFHRNWIESLTDNEQTTSTLVVVIWW